MKTILVPVDLSSAAAGVCKAACDLARSLHASLLLVHVVQYPVMLTDIYGLEAPYIEDAVNAATQVGKQKLAALARVCVKRGIKVRIVQAVGSPVNEILSRSRRVSLIVIGSHGHGAVYDLVVGSTTQGVLRKAKCPVLVVPARQRS
jgi:nucleotide-binding universal stress UspA family protein